MYYIAGIASLVLAVAFQLSIGEFFKIASFKPTFVLIPLVFFSVGLHPVFLPSWASSETKIKMDQVKFKNGWAGWYFPRHTPFENAFRGAILGLAAGILEGINSGFLPGSIFSWAVAGSVCGFFAAPVNKNNRVVRAVFLFSASLIQGIIFYLLLSAISGNYKLSLILSSVLVPSFYNAAIGIPLLSLIEKKRKEGVIEEFN